MLADGLPPDWRAQLEAAVSAPSFAKLEAFLAQEAAAGTQVFPPPELIFSAFHLTPFDQVRAVILGQDPYHDDGQAHGLSFSVQPGVRIPGSLNNIFKELNTDLGIPKPKSGNLEAWAKRGVLMLNAVLTVRAHTPNSHRNQGWEAFTDAVIQQVSAQAPPCVFLLWGGPAKSKAPLIDPARHRIVDAAHPSPLNRSGFLGTRPFSRANAALIELGREPIDWRL